VGCTAPLSWRSLRSHSSHSYCYSRMHLQSAQVALTLSTNLKLLKVPFSLARSLFPHTHTHTPSLTVCLSFAGVAALDAVNLEDRIVWQLVTSVLAHRRAHYAKRVDNLRLFVRTGLFKTYRLHSISLCIFAGHLTVIL
jgi:hypothetical protein